MCVYVARINQIESLTNVHHVTVVTQRPALLSLMLGIVWWPLAILHSRALCTCMVLLHVLQKNKTKRKSQFTAYIFCINMIKVFAYLPDDADDDGFAAVGEIHAMQSEVIFVLVIRATLF